MLELIFTLNLRPSTEKASGYDPRQSSKSLAQINFANNALFRVTLQLVYVRDRVYNDLS